MRTILSSGAMHFTSLGSSFRSRRGSDLSVLGTWSNTTPYLTRLETRSYMHKCWLVLGTLSTYRHEYEQVLDQSVSYRLAPIQTRLLDTKGRIFTSRLTFFKNVLSASSTNIIVGWSSRPTLKRKLLLQLNHGSNIFWCVESFMSKLITLPWVWDAAALQGRLSLGTCRRCWLLWGPWEELLYPCR